MLEPSANPMVRRDYLGDLDVQARITEHLQVSRSGQRTSVEKFWRVNLLAYSGEPYYRINEAGMFEEVDPQYRDRYVYVNIGFNVVQTLAGRMTYEPKVEASTAASFDVEDVFRTRAAADLGNHAIRASGLVDAYSRAMVLVHSCGLAWLKTWWDPGRGRRGPAYGAIPCNNCGGTAVVAHPATGLPVACPVCGAQGVIPSPGLKPLQPGMMYDVVGESPEGELVVEVVSPWEVFPDPEARHLSEIRKLVHEREISRTSAYEQFGKELGITEEDFQRSGDDPEITFTIRTGDGWTKPSRREYVRMREYWELPSEKYPEGIYAVMIGGDLVRAGPLPYAHGRLPFVPLLCYEIPGALYPKSTLDMVLPLIHTACDHLSNINARAHQSVHMRILAPRRSAVSISDKPGIVYYEHVPGRPAPTELNIGPPPSDAGQIVDYMVKYIDQVSGAIDVMRGEQTPGVDSARAAAWFDEQAMSRLKPMMDSHARALETVIRLLIDTAKLFYADDRIIRVFGALGAAESQAFRLENIGDSEDVILRAERDLGRSRSVRMQDYNDAYDRKIIDASTYLELTEVASSSGIYEERKMHEGAAMLENATVRTGAQLGFPQLYENHDVHMKVHTRLLLELRMNAPGDPRIQMLTDHLEKTEELKAYEQIRVQTIMAQAAAQYGMVGASATSNQTPAAASQAQAAGMGAASSQAPQSTEPASNAPPGPPESQSSLGAADQASRSPEAK